MFPCDPMDDVSAMFGQRFEVIGKGIVLTTTQAQSVLYVN